MRISILISVRKISRHHARQSRPIQLERRGAILLLAFACNSLAGAAPTPAAPFLSFDMPYGGCRLSVHGDGSGFLSFGALPQQVRVPAGTFDLPELRAIFASKARPGELRYELNPPVGGVRSERAAEDSFFNDSALANALLERAWAHRAAPRNDIEREYERIIASFCARSGIAVPIDSIDAR